MARAALGLGVRDLAIAADMSPNTIARLERSEVLKPATLAAIRAALEIRGIQFLEGGQVATGPGVAISERKG
jgi:transcriptional regulator with XRE-family HTH domain